MSEETKKISPVLQAVIDFSTKIRETSPKTAEGKNEYYTSKLTYEPRYKEPGKKDPVFTLSNHHNESIKFKMSYQGNLINATYFNRNVKDENGKSQVVFVGKDFAKLSEVVQDKGLAAMASNMSWEKVPAKETVEPEIEQETDDIELE